MSRYDIPTTESGLIRAHGLAALAMVVYSALLGLAVALKFHWPDFLGDTAWLTWGRLRYAHTQGIFFGWLGNAFLAFFYHRRAAAGRAARHQPCAGLAAVRRLELLRGHSRLGAGADWASASRWNGPSSRLSSTCSSSSRSC